MRIPKNHLCDPKYSCMRLYVRTHALARLQEPCLLSCLPQWRHKPRRFVSSPSSSKSQNLSTSQIQERIKASQDRRALNERHTFHCPGCKQRRFKPPALVKHMVTCCPDLLQNVQVQILFKHHAHFLAPCHSQQACDSSDVDAVP
jgi:hypothetical protein